MDLAFWGIYQIHPKLKQYEPEKSANFPFNYWNEIELNTEQTIDSIHSKKEMKIRNRN